MIGIVLYVLVLILLLIFLIAYSIYMSSMIYSALKGAPFVPTRMQQVHQILENAELKKGMKFLEIGSGDGRVVSEAVLKYGVFGTGIEINPLLVTWSRMIAHIRALKGVEFIIQDVRHTDFSEYDVIYIFLLPELVTKIQDKMLEQCKPGTTIISHGFRITGWEPRLVEEKDWYPYHTYYYKI